jgi:predicted nucleic acid-binding protein
MTFLLDTNVISELRRPERAAPSVREWVAEQAPEALWCSVVSAIELEIGALQMLRRDPVQGRMLRTWIDGMDLPRFAGRIIPVEIDVALRCASLHVPDPMPDRDAYIAATALVHDLTVVTRNVRDFQGTGVRMFNPWEDAG